MFDKMNKINTLDITDITILELLYYILVSPRLSCKPLFCICPSLFEFECRGSC